MSLPTDRQDGDVIENEDINTIAAQVNRISKDVAATRVAPVFRTQQDAREYELLNPGKTALWWDSGYQPPVTYVEDFEVAAPNLYATTLDGRPWTKGLMGAFGVSEATMAMGASGGFATHTAGIGAGAFIDVAALNTVTTINYDLTGGSPTATRQVRVAGRGDPAYTIPSGRPNMPVQVAVTYAGEVRLDPWVDPADSVYKSFVLGTGAPPTGNLKVAIGGSTVRVYINGTQVGSDFTIAGSQLSGTKVGFGVYQGGKVERFEVVAGG